MRLRTLAFWIVPLLVLSLALIGGGLAARGRARRQLRAGLDEAARDLAAGYNGLAFKRLSELAEDWPGHPEVEYRLGACQMARGRREEALAAWARVPAGSEFAARAAEQRATQLINTGRYTPAEEALEAALHGPATAEEREALRRAYDRLLRFEGRVDDLRHLLLSTWADATDPAAVLRELWLIDTSPIPLEAWSRALGVAGRDDDRVWLGRAHAAILSGRLDEAARWVEACLKRRPDDPAVWRAKLALAEASNDPDAVRAAAVRLPADVLPEPRVRALRVWLARARGDRDAERLALRRLLEAEPGQADALERLAVLAREDGRDEEAAALLGRKAELDRARSRYRSIVLDAAGMASHARELAELAEALGRSFDARAWSLLADGRGRSEAARALARAVAAPAASAGSLADRLVESSVPATATAVAAPPARGATPPVFVDDAGPAGLRFSFDNGQTDLRQLPETMSGGVGVLDVDGDGWLDVYCVQGGPLAPEPDAPAGDRLFRNRGDGTFEDITEAAGLPALVRGYGHGVTVADFDDDGRPDVFLTRLRSYQLLRNRGDGTFEDVTEAAGLGGVRDNPTSAAFADLDGDGDLDLYVCHYMRYDPADPRLCLSDKGAHFYCDPSRVEPAPDHLFRNDGGRFVDVSEESGVATADVDGRGLGVVAVDLDDDGRLDLYVANDGTANFLLLNRGGMRFEESAHASGVAAGAGGGYQASMGVACGDPDGDGRPDLLVTNFYGESSTLYRNLGRGQFQDATAATGLGVATRFLLGFGTAFLDYDADGRLDLLTINGHVNDNRPFYPYAMPAQLLAGTAAGTFVDVSAGAGAPWSVPRVGRGLATADLDNDGRTDALLLSQNEPLAYLHNRTPGGHWLTFRLEGSESGRDAIGARVTVRAGGRTQAAWRFGGGSYQSALDPRLHFGLEEADRASVEVRWPGAGRVDRFDDLPADAAYLLREGSDAPRPLPVFER